jgi:2-phosphosulfolactate phosphatase
MKTVVIDCFPESVVRYRNGYAVVAVDVVRATTTAISAVAAGRRCLLVSTTDAAYQLAATLGNPLLVGEQRGVMPPGFHLNNSPVELLARTDLERPAILLSSSGTRLCSEASACHAAFLACFRNYTSLTAHLEENFSKVAVIGAGSRGEFRREDQICCALIAERLAHRGFVPETSETNALIKRWENVPIDAWVEGKSAAYLRDTGQLNDLAFILDNTDDLSALFTMHGSEVIMAEPGALGSRCDRSG